MLPTPCERRFSSRCQPLSRISKPNWSRSRSLTDDGSEVTGLLTRNDTVVSFRALIPPRLEEKTRHANRLLHTTESETVGNFLGTNSPRSRCMAYSPMFLLIGAGSGLEQNQRDKTAPGPGQEAEHENQG